MSDNYEDKNNVYAVTNRILYSISSQKETSGGKAILAKLRNSIGKNPSEMLDVWKIVFQNVPDNFLSDYGLPTREERAILTSLQLYALHQQGKSENVCSFEDIYYDVGKSLNTLKNIDNAEAIDRRFNAMITSATFEELVEHLKHLIKLLKAKTNSQVNYAKLASDLFWFQIGSKEKVKFSWAQSYYSNKSYSEKGD